MKRLNTYGTNVEQLRFKNMNMMQNTILKLKVEKHINGTKVEQCWNTNGTPRKERRGINIQIGNSCGTQVEHDMVQYLCKKGDVKFGT